MHLGARREPRALLGIDTPPLQTNIDREHRPCKTILLYHPVSFQGHVNLQARGAPYFNVDSC